MATRKKAQWAIQDMLYAGDLTQQEADRAMYAISMGYHPIHWICGSTLKVEYKEEELNAINA